MTNATGTTVTIDPREAAHFGAMAADWWDPKGSSAMLHKLNPVRLDYIREHIDRTGMATPGLTPLAGKPRSTSAAARGCSREPLARMGAAVTGIDAAAENVAAARAHAPRAGLTSTIARAASRR